MTLNTILEDLVSVKSITADVEECRKLLAKVLEMVPSPSISSDQSILFWGHCDLSSAEWLVNTHVDVVPGLDTQFLLSVKGDKAWGRGVADVKGCAAILINQAKKWSQVAKEKNITFMLVSDEEVGGASTKAILPQMENLQGAIFLEPTGLQVTTQAKGMMQVKIVAHGSSCHGSRPWEGDNAIEILSRGLVQFRMTQPSPTQETRETTFNFSQIEGGEAINQVPRSAELWCDVRFNPLDQPERIAAIIQTCFPACEIHIIKAESPIDCKKDTRIFQSLVRSIKACSINPLSRFDHGTSDARHGTALGIPSLVFGPKGSGLHSDHEWVSIKSLAKVEMILDHWIHNI